MGFFVGLGHKNTSDWADVADSKGAVWSDCLLPSGVVWHGER